MKKWRPRPAVFLPAFIATGILISVMASSVLHDPEEKLTNAGRVAPFIIGGMVGLAVWSLVYFWRKTFLSDGNHWS